MNISVFWLKEALMFEWKPLSQAFADRCDSGGVRPFSPFLHPALFSTCTWRPHHCVIWRRNCVVSQTWVFWQRSQCCLVPFTSQTDGYVPHGPSTISHLYHRALPRLTDKPAKLHRGIFPDVWRLWKVNPEARSTIIGARIQRRCFWWSEKIAQ